MAKKYSGLNQFNVGKAPKIILMTENCNFFDSRPSLLSGCMHIVQLLHNINYNAATLLVGRCCDCIFCSLVNAVAKSLINL